MNKLTIAWGDIYITIEKPDSVSVEPKVVKENPVERATPRPYPVQEESFKSNIEAEADKQTKPCVICGEDFTPRRKDSKCCQKLECIKAVKKQYQDNHKSGNTRLTKKEAKAGKVKLPPGERIKPYKHNFKPETRPVIKDSTPAIF